MVSLRSLAVAMGYIVGTMSEEQVAEAKAEMEGRKYKDEGETDRRNEEIDLYNRLGKEANR